MFLFDQFTYRIITQINVYSFWIVATDFKLDILIGFSRYMTISGFMVFQPVYRYVPLLFDE